MEEEIFAKIKKSMVILLIVCSVLSGTVTAAGAVSGNESPIRTACESYYHVDQETGMCYTAECCDSDCVYDEFYCGGA